MNDEVLRDERCNRVRYPILPLAFVRGRLALSVTALSQLRIDSQWETQRTMRKPPTNRMTNTIERRLK